MASAENTKLEDLTLDQNVLWSFQLLEVARAKKRPLHRIDCVNAIFGCLTISYLYYTFPFVLLAVNGYSYGEEDIYWRIMNKYLGSPKFHSIPIPALLLPAALFLFMLLIDLVLFGIGSDAPAHVETPNLNGVEKKLECLEENLGNAQYIAGDSGMISVLTVICSVCIWSILSMALLYFVPAEKLSAWEYLVLGVLFGVAALIELCISLPVLRAVSKFFFRRTVLPQLKERLDNLCSGLYSYKEKVRFDAMSPEEQRQYLLKQQKEREEAERRQKEEAREYAKFLSWKAEKERQGVVFDPFEPGGMRLTSTDHDDLDLAQRMMNRDKVYGEDWKGYDAEAPDSYDYD